MAIMGSGAGGSGAGGSGAGGSGAGGSGAGGSGAGGSGAGGSGAGGSGAGGHAGGPTSGMLNTALTITSDAITGFWDGSPDLTPLGKPAGHGDLSYLTPSRRMSMFAAEALGQFKVNEATAAHGGVSKATVDFAENRIHEVETPDAIYFGEQLKWLRNYADLRVDRIPEINVQIQDLLSFFGMVGQLDAGEHKHTLEALGVVQDVTYSVTMLVKHNCWAPRPIAFGRRVHPMIQTPDHSSFPSAHASESFAMATVLEHIFGLAKATGTTSMAYRVAHRISANRTVAGVHFPVDSYAGAQLGIAMGHAMIALMFGDKPKATVFVPGNGTTDSVDANEFQATDDFLLSELDVSGSDIADSVDVKQPSMAKIYGTQIKKEWVLK